MYQVLIVEDDPMVANIDKLWVERSGDLHVVAVCRDGAEALSTLEQTPVELIILALKLPDMNGLELVRGTVTDTGMGASSRFFSTRSFTASSMEIPWDSASSAMGASKIRRRISASAASSTAGAVCAAVCVFAISQTVLSVLFSALRICCWIWSLF